MMTSAEIETYVDAAAVALALPLSAEHRSGVLTFFALAANFAAVVEAVPLDVRTESAVQFLPVAPGTGGDNA